MLFRSDCSPVFRCGMEIYEDLPDTDVIIACCGGGGFLAGVSSAAKVYNPQCKVYGVEPMTGMI